MKRAELLKMLKRRRPAPRPEDLSDPFIRDLEAMSARAEERFVKDVRAILADRTLTDDDRFFRWRAASGRRHRYVGRRLDAFRERLDRETRANRLRLGRGPKTGRRR